MLSSEAAPIAIEAIVAEKTVVEETVTVTETEVVVVAEPVAEPEPVAAPLANPTLSDLVRKLQNEPWARPTQVADPVLERHAAKFPLGGQPPEEPKEPKP